MLPLSMEEKVKVWTMFGESYKLSAFYVVGPVAIDSEKISKPKRRVDNVFLDTKHYEFKKVLKFDTFIKEEDIDDEYTQRPDEDEDEDDDYGLGGDDDDELGLDDDEEGGADSSDSEDDDLDSELDLDSDLDLDAELGLDSDSEDSEDDSESDSEDAGEDDLNIESEE